MLAGWEGFGIPGNLVMKLLALLPFLGTLGQSQGRNEGQQVGKEALNRGKCPYRGTDGSLLPLAARYCRIYGLYSSCRFNELSKTTVTLDVYREKK